MTRKELESALETRCCQRIEALGGLALKLVIPGVRGFPDRSCALPGGRMFFLEVKRIKTGRVSAQQVRWGDLLRGRDFGFYLVDTDADFEAALQKELDR